MQAVNDQQPTQTPTDENTTSSAFVLPLEVVAYAILVALVIILRTASLGTVPMTDTEAVRALPAYHAVFANAAGTPQEAQSVVVFWLQAMSFVIFGSTEFAARFPGVIGAVLLTLMPLFFYNRFGRERTFLLSVVLAFSPIAFTAARLADPTIFAMIGVLGVLWAVWNAWDNRTQSSALILAAWVGFTALLTGASGFLVSLLLLLAGVLTVVSLVYTAPEDRDSPGDDILLAINDWLGQLPWIQMALVIVGLGIAIATGFFFRPAGLNIIAEAIATGLQGFVVPASPNLPPSVAILAIGTYELPLLILGVIAMIVVAYTNTDTPIDRFVLITAMISFVVLILYRGAEPSYALWLILPLAYFVSRLMSGLFDNQLPVFLSLQSYYSDDPNDYGWVKGLAGIIMFTGLIMMSLYLASLGRAMLTFPADAALFDETSVLLYVRAGWFVIMGALLVVLYFLLSSIYGHTSILQGYGLGGFAFMIVMGIGTGWNTSVVHVSNPAELWHTSAVTEDAYQLRETLFDVARRDSRGFPQIELTILRAPEQGITDDGLVAWLVRDFENAEFVDTMGDVRQDEVALLPLTEDDPDLGGSYVGQSFTLREYWVSGTMRPLEWVSWYAQRRTNPRTVPSDVSVLWLRIDIYDGAPAFQNP